MKELKNSGISWVGKCPTHWQVMRNKYIMHKIKHIPPSYQGEAILSLSMKGVIVRDLEAGGKMPSSFNGYQTLYPGNLLMCLFDYDVTPRCIGLIKNYGVSSPAYSQFELDNGNVASYFYYYYLMVDNEKSILHLAKNLRHSFTEEQLGCIEAPVPPVKEQQAIASFLDEKCTEIDALVEDIQAEISTLEELKKSIITEAVTKGLDPNVEMLPSGMFGCDYRPAHWKTSKLKFFTYVRARLGWKGLKADEYVETGYPFLSAFNIQNSELSLESVNYISQDRYDESPEIKLKIGDILLVKDGAGIGKCAYVDQLPHPSTVNGSLAVITCFPEVLGKLLYYFFLSTPFQNIIALLKDGMGVPHLFQSDIRSIVFEFPESIQEQCSIINHLEQEISKINAIISNKNKQLKILQEYKKSLIYEYVTGKKEVPQK